MATNPLNKRLCSMQAPTEFGAEAASLTRLRACMSEFGALVRGNELNSQTSSHLTEDREGVMGQLAKAIGLPVWKMRIGQNKIDGLTDAKDRFAISRTGFGGDFPLWHELPDWISTHCGGMQLLLDLTTLGGSSIFQFHAAAIKAGNVRLSYAYTTPKHYPQVDKPDAIPPMVTRSIKQPYGYRSFAQEHLRVGERRHVIVLGFDRHRPNKFIEHYQWPLDGVFALLGDPAYVQGGVEQARKSLGPVFGELERLGHIRIVNPKLLWNDGDERGVVDVLTELGSQVSSMDIVPLGPKPTLLGCAVYWHSLPESLQQQTRLLYDFPVSRQVRTKGVDVTWLYRDIVVPRRTNGRGNEGLADGAAP